MKEDVDLDRLAEAELLLEAKRGLARSNVFGPTGWKRCPLPGANKKFLQNTIMNAMSSNKLKEQSSGVKRSKVEHRHRIKHGMKKQSCSQYGHNKVKERKKCSKHDKALQETLKHKVPNDRTMCLPSEKVNSDVRVGSGGEHCGH